MSQSSLHSQPDPSQGIHTRFQEILLLLLVGLVLMVLAGGWSAATRALATDELFSLLTAEGSFREILQNLSAYQPGYFDHPPFFFLLLHGVLPFGNSPLMLRLLPLLFAAGAIGILGMVLRRQGLSWCLTLSVQCAFASVPLILQQGTFVRMYSLVTFLSMLLFLILLRQVPNTRSSFFKQVISIGFILSLLVYTSYFAGLLGVGVGCFGLLQIARGRLQKNVTLIWSGSAILLGCLVAFLLYLPWLPTVWRLLNAEAEAQRPVVLGMAGRFIFLYQYFLGLSGHLTGVVVLLCGWGGLLVYHTRKVEFGMMLGAFVFVPLITLAFFTPETRPLGVRYLVFTFPLIWIGAAMGWHQLFNLPRVSRRLKPHWQMVVFLLFVPFGLYQSYSGGLKPVPDWWEAASIIERHATDREDILTGGFLSGEAMVYHMNNPDDFQFLHYITEMDPFYLACRSPKTVWYINAAPIPESYQAIVERYFPYGAHFAGNLPISRQISIYAKKKFQLSTGETSVFKEPVPLPYE